MRVFVLSAIFGASFVTVCVSVVLMNWIFWVSLAVLAGTCLYINRHENELNAELDEMFGRDDSFAD